MGCLSYKKETLFGKQSVVMSSQHNFEPILQLILLLFYPKYSASISLSPLASSPTSSPKLNEYINSCEPCFVHIINFEGLTLPFLKFPVLLTRYVIQATGNRTFPNFEILFPYNVHSSLNSMMNTKLNISSPENNSKPGGDHLYRFIQYGSSKRWMCEVHFYLFPPSPADKPQYFAESNYVRNSTTQNLVLLTPLSFVAFHWKYNAVRKMDRVELIEAQSLHLPLAMPTYFIFAAESSQPLILPWYFTEIERRLTSSEFLIKLNIFKTTNSQHLFKVRKVILIDLVDFRNISALHTYSDRDRESFLQMMDSTEKYADMVRQSHFFNPETFSAYICNALLSSIFRNETIYKGYTATGLFPVMKFGKGDKFSVQHQVTIYATQFDFIACGTLKKLKISLRFAELFSSFDMYTWIGVINSFVLILIIFIAGLKVHRNGKPGNILSFLVKLPIEQGCSSFEKLTLASSIKWLTSGYLLAWLFLSGFYKGDNIINMTSPTSPTPIQYFDQLVKYNVVTYSFPVSYFGNLSAKEPDSPFKQHMNFEYDILSRVLIYLSFENFPCQLFKWFIDTKTSHGKGANVLESFKTVPEMERDSYRIQRSVNKVSRGTHHKCYFHLRQNLQRIPCSGINNSDIYDFLDSVRIEG